MQTSQMQQGQTAAAALPRQQPPAQSPSPNPAHFQNNQLVVVSNPTQQQPQRSLPQQQQHQQQQQNSSQVYGAQQGRPVGQGQQQPQVYGVTAQQPQQHQQPQLQQHQQPTNVAHQRQQPPPQVQQSQQQQQQQPQQPHLPHHGLNGGWQSDKDYQDRRKMIAKIVHLLQQRKPNAPQEWLKKLPQMAKRLEESLYRSAKSFEEYNDASTLKHRLQQLAVNIGMKTKKMTQQQALMQQQKLQGPQQPQQQNNPNAPLPPQPIQFTRPPSQNATPAPAQLASQPVPLPTAPAPLAQSLQQLTLVNMAEINPNMSQQHPQTQPQTHQPPLQSVQSVSYNPTQPAASVPTPVSNTSSVPDTMSANTNGNRQISDRQQVLRHQQQRLLLLRHAAKCLHEDGKCPVTPHCAGMKRLWRHIAECKNQKCLVPHCVSSRYVLSHYHRCKDVRCPVCGPVREAIHRSHEKQKQMQALKQRHQQAVQQTLVQGAPAPSSTLPPIGNALPPPAQAPISGIEPPNKRQKTALIPSSTSLGLQPPNTQSSLHQQFSQPLDDAAVPMMSASSVPSTLSSGPPFVTTDAATAQVAAPPDSALTNGQVIMPKIAGPKPQEDHTLINCFTLEQIETHIASLSNGLVLAPQRLKTKCLDVLKTLQSHQDAWVFNTPVDPVELGLPDYFEVIKKPMDLGTIRKKLDNGVYQKLEEFEEHVLLTFDNAMLYNPEGSVVYNMAKDMKAQFQQDYQRMMDQLHIEEDIKRRNGEACLLCGCEKLLFEPPVFYCNGLNCPSKRIRRNSYYYVGGNNQYHWCHQCFQELRDNATIDLGDISIKKEQLIKKKNDELHEESWVQCDRCERWVHQICALFNTRQNKDQRSEYACPKCTIEERKQKGCYDATSSTPMAEDLPRTKLSEVLENHVRYKVDEFLEKRAHEKVAKEGITLEEAKKKVQMGGAITIRQVTSMDRRLEVRDRMKKRYAFKNYPDEFTFRCKCIVVFQNLDGVDVVLFGLYVYEHDEKNPAPNTRTVYVSYLDSVHYMRPREMRTFIYHEILIAYLDYVRKRGFASAHIWACPPLKGDDYILYAKPEDQKTPKDDRLRQWYIDMLIECQRRGIVGKLTNMYDLYFSNEKNDATVVPYMDGDYFPAEVENIIKDIEEGKVGKKSSSQGKKKKEKQKKKTGRGGTRSTGLDEEALKASGIVTPGKDAKSLEEGARDYVMVKLGETIQPMKESFIVAFLAWEGASEENMVVPPDIENYRRQHNITWKLPPSTKRSSSISTVESKNGENGSTGNASNDAVVKSEEGIKAETPPNGDSMEAEIKKENDSSDPVSSSGASNNDANEHKNVANLSIREGKFAAMAARKRNSEGETKEPEKSEDNNQGQSSIVKDSKGRAVKVLDDDDEELDCEFLNNRQAFLNLCQGNHYQFDQLRRAKHSSMMVLWHLHNRDAPKFVQQCATCAREILTGYRYHCPTCADFDQCHECISNPNIARHIHPLKPLPVASSQQNEMSDQQRKERQRSIQLHMTLLLHAATCDSPKCPSANCTKMKGLLKHGAQCSIKATGGCNVCKRIWALLQLHARQCKAKRCLVPNCMAIRERFRQLKKQQQAMDDRRRQEMNRAYRSKR